MERKYDIGNGWIITDDGLWLRADFSDGSGRFSKSSGVCRPRVGPIPEEFEATFSADERFLYLNRESLGLNGFWLGVTKWTSREEMEAQQRAGIFGKTGAQFSLESGEVYYRETLYFSGWKVASKQDRVRLPFADEMVKDYLSLLGHERRHQEARFNEFIAESGRTLEWIIYKIGAWIPDAPEPPPIPLTD